MLNVKELLTLASLLFNPVTYGADIISYSDIPVDGVLGEQAIIQYGDSITDNKVLWSPTYSLLTKFGKTPMTSNPVKDWDRIVAKDFLTLSSNFNSSETAGEELTITLAQDDKNNITVGQNLRFAFTPATSAFTNEVVVTDKRWSTDRTTIKVKPVDLTLKIGINTGAAAVVAATYPKVLVLGTMHNVISDAQKGLSFQPTTVQNYHQFFRQSYEWSMIEEKYKLYTKGSIRNKQMEDTRAKFLRDIEKALIYNGNYVSRSVADTSQATLQATYEFSKMKGIEYWIKNGGSPAVSGYDSFDYDTFDDWQWLLFDPELMDTANRRFVLTNKAGRKFFTDLKKDKPGVELAPNGAYGIPGITTVYTDAGTIDLYAHNLINMVYSDKDKPYFLALTLPFVKIYEHTKPQLRTDIGDRKSSGYMDEFQCVMSLIINGAGTAYHGVLYPNS